MNKHLIFVRNRDTEIKKSGACPQKSPSVAGIVKVHTNNCSAVPKMLSLKHEQRAVGTQRKSKWFSLGE